MESAQRTPNLHRVCDALSGGLLLAMLVFAPWAFGCTLSWAIWTMCGGGYALGILLLLKYVVRWREDYSPERWVNHEGIGLWAVRALAGLTVLMLLWVLVSSWNARADVELNVNGPILHYRDRTPIPWLPTSYDAGRTFRAFWRYLALALTFWAARDWISTKTRRERKDEAEAVVPTARIRQVVWTLCISSALLALVSIAQRLDGTDKLFWMIKPLTKNPPQFTWGPYAYRTNGAQYFNLVWPVVLAFWWTLRERNHRLRKGSARLGADSHILLLPCTLLLAACPLISSSRGGTLIMITLLAGTLAVLAAARGTSHRSARGVVAGVFLAVLALGWFAGGEALRQRFSTVFEDRMSNRLDLYEAAGRMVADAGPFGTGAETFTGLFALYRNTAEDTWHGFAHNDWLETRITFGWVGLTLIVLMLILLAVIWATGRGLVAPREYNFLVGLSLGGLLIHARFDFPFQMFSLIYLFLMITALALSTAAREGQVAPRTSSSTRRKSHSRRSSRSTTDTGTTPEDGESGTGPAQQPATA